MSLRGAFLDSLGFAIDPFQLHAIDALDAGRTVVVAAPTGSGKTVVAEYAVAKAMARGAKAFYTTPLKALSNQKYLDLCRAYGSERVGLLTGDNSINGDAAIVVMTTEVLRNMIYAASTTLDGLAYVVLDEVHYLQDPYRGAVWEEVIIHTPPEVDLVCLSATVSNAEQFAEWVSTVRGEAEAVIEERRPVELRQLYMFGDRSTRALEMLPVFVEGRPNMEAAQLDARARGARRGPGRRGRFYSPRRTEVVEALGAEEMRPAIYFIFSRAGCDNAVRFCLEDGVALTTPDERRRIREIAEAKVDQLSDDDLGVLGYGPWLAGLEAGVAAHHAGLVPPFKEAVESCFAEALVKVVFATETLSLGINMPARTVVIEKLSKFGGERHEDLTPGEYTQLTGRAGRRGIDAVGYAVVLWSRLVSFEAVASLASARTYELTSSFAPTYNMAANLVRRYEAVEAHHLLNLSFAQFRANAEVVRLESRIERLERDLARDSEGGRPARLRAEAARLEKRLDRIGANLSERLDRVLGLLEDRGYVKGWSLTAAGETLARIYHETDLLVAEALGRGLLDGLEPPVLAGLVSTFTYEQRGRERPLAPRFPGAHGEQRWERLVGLGRELASAEALAGLALTRPLDAGFFAMAHSWASGRDLERVVGQELSGGDFVRNIKQLVDLLTQIADVAQDPRTASAARLAARAVFRGVVSASSVVGADGSATGATAAP